MWTTDFSTIKPLNDLVTATTTTTLYFQYQYQVDQGLTFLCLCCQFSHHKCLKYLGREVNRGHCLIHHFFMDVVVVSVIISL